MSHLPVATGARRAAVSPMPMLWERWLRSPGLPGPLAAALRPYFLRGSLARHVLFCKLLPPHPRQRCASDCPFATQVCKFRFHFTPRYAENAPSRLPLAELVTGLAAKTEASARAASRVTSVCSLHLISACICQGRQRELLFRLRHVQLLACAAALAPVLLTRCRPPVTIPTTYRNSPLQPLWQVLMVVVVWLWIVPLLTCWMWRLGFTTSFLHGWNTVSQRMSPLLLLADCIQVRTMSCPASGG